MKIINKDITTVEKGIIVSQVNCQSVQGSGLAKIIRDKWPIVYDGYINYIQDVKFHFFLPHDHMYKVPKWTTEKLLGHINIVEVNKDLYVCNLFGQDTYGREKKQYTSYEAWDKALPKLKKYSEKVGLPVYFPYLCGCDRGGANFTIISQMILENLPDAIICKI